MNRIESNIQEFKSEKDLEDRMDLILYALNDTVAPTPKLEYDQHPLVAVSDIFPWGFRGINFHLRDYRQYTWQELGTQVYVVQQEELDDLMSLNYKKMVLNK